MLSFKPCLTKNDEEILVFLSEYFGIFKFLFVLKSYLRSYATDTRNGDIFLIVPELKVRKVKL